MEMPQDGNSTAGKLTVFLGNDYPVMGFVFFARG